MQSAQDHFGSIRSDPICFGLVESPTPYVDVTTATIDLRQSGMFGVVDTVSVASATSEVTPASLVAAIATVQAAASHERVAGAAVVARALAGTTGPLVAATVVGASASTIAGVVGPLVATATIGAPDPLVTIVDFGAPQAPP
jgi:hypothetical protein